MRAPLVAAAVLVAATACGPPPQTATVRMGDGVCTVAPSAFKSGDVEFTVHNDTDRRVPFVVNEDGDTTKVREIDVDPRGATTVTVRFDGADKYQLHCGDVRGPEITPSS